MFDKEYGVLGKTLELKKWQLPKYVKAWVYFPEKQSLVSILAFSVFL